MFLSKAHKANKGLRASNGKFIWQYNGIIWQVLFKRNYWIAYTYSIT